VGELAPWHWVIIAILIVVLFGSAKLPGAARSIGRSMRIFKSEIKGLHDDDDAAPAPSGAASTGTPSTSRPAAAPPTAGPAAPTAETSQMREEAARLREQAAALERQANIPQPLSAPEAVRSDRGRSA
jgi:sec-independent protein translocase protein TatA